MQKTTLQTNAKLSFTEFALNNARDVVLRSNDASHFFHNLAQLPQTIYALSSLEAKLGMTFRSYEWPLKALIHRSFMNDAKDKGINSNERLEFLGDSLVGAIVSKTLFEKFNHLPEGDLSKLRAALVNEISFTELAKCLGLQDLLIVGKGEFLDKNYLSGGALADAFEAIMAAVYKDQGQEALELAFNNTIQLLDDEFYDTKRLNDFDPKTRLQEKTMALYKVAPIYEAKEVTIGKFLVTLKIQEKNILSLEGHSKKKTEKELARRVLAQNLHLEGDQNAH